MKNGVSRSIQLFALSHIVCSIQAMDQGGRANNIDFAHGQNLAAWYGIRAGLTTGSTIGLATAWWLRSPAYHNNRAVAGGVLLGNVVVPTYVNSYFGHKFKNALVQESPSLTSADKSELYQRMNTVATMTDSLVSSALISGLAAGAMRTMVRGPEEANSFKNFCITFPFVFAGITALRYATAQCWQQVPKKKKRMQN